MIEANKTIFGQLDQFAEQHGNKLDNAGHGRWIRTEKADKSILIDAKLSKAIKISSTRSFGRFDCGVTNLFVLFGFDPALESSWLSHFDPTPGLITLALSELRPRPVRSSLEIKQIVDAQDERESGYNGHDARDIASLYPIIKAFSDNDLSDDETGRIVFDLFLSETQLSNNWIEAELASELRQLTDLKLIGIPYLMLARSLLDYDPSSLFMALYRCLEGLYAFTGSNAIRNVLDVKQPWTDVAVALEEHLSWRPIEWQSLEVLTGMGAEADLALICDAIRPAFPGDAPAEIARAASSYLYKLRNSVVHFRPTHANIRHDVVDWNTLCRACTMLIAYVYSEVFESI